MTAWRWAAPDPREELADRRTAAPGEGAWTSSGTGNTPPRTTAGRRTARSGCPCPCRRRAPWRATWHSRGPHFLTHACEQVILGELGVHEGAGEFELLPGEYLPLDVQRHAEEP